MYNINASIFHQNPWKLGRCINMSKEINAYNVNDILPLITYILEHEEINISDMAKRTGIARSTLYDFLYKDSNDLQRIQKILTYLGVQISIKLASK